MLNLARSLARLAGLAEISLNQRYFVAFLALLVWAPLPLGSNRPWAWALLEVGVFLLAACWLGSWLQGRVKINLVFRKALPVLLVLALWLLYLLLQWVPLPYAWVAALSPQAAQLHGAAQAMAPAYVTLSVDAHATAVFWLKSCAYALVFALALLLVNRRRRVEQLALVLVFSGLLQAVYGGMMTLSGLEYGFLVKKVTYLGVATGTFVNRNHLAGYLEMTLALGIGLMIGSLGGGSGESWRQRLRSLVQWIFSPKMRLRLYLAAMVIGLVLTRSRMGNTAFFSSLLIAGVAGLVLSRHATRATVILLASLIVIDLFIVGSLVGIEKVSQRLEQTSLAGETRDEVVVYAYRQWQDYFWTGSGGGSFYSVFPRYRGGDVAQYYDHAHNDYLELAGETGLVGIALLGLALAWSLLAALRAQYRRRDPLMRGMAFSAVMAIAALLIHSAVDFNLQIPANAATFMLMLALAWIALHLEAHTDAAAKAQ